METKRTALALCILYLAIGLAGCREAIYHADNDSFRVALLTPGPVSDAGWNAAAFEGLQLIRRKLKAQVVSVETASPSDFEDSFRDFARRHFKLVFAHGFEYSDAALAVARDFPATYFVVTSGSVSAPNVASLSFKLEEAAYVEGLLAAAASHTGIAGEIGGIELPAIRLTFDSFKRGFLSSRPTGRVLITYTGSFNDVGAAKEAALAQIGRGADILFHNADAAGLGVFQAVLQTHCLAFGITRDQSAVAPDAVLASAVAEIPEAFLKIAREVEAGHFRSGILEYGMSEGMVKVVLNPRLVSRLPDDAIQRADLAERDIAARKLSVTDLAAFSSEHRP